MFPSDFCRLQKQIPTKLEMRESTCWWLPPWTLRVERLPAIHVVVVFAQQIATGRKKFGTALSVSDVLVGLQEACMGTNNESQWTLFMTADKDNS